MVKLFYIFTAIALMFSSQVCSSQDKLKEEIMFSAYNNGNQIEMTEEDVSNFDALFSAALKDCNPMPAYGVSLHDETMKAIQEGIWIRFEFDEELTVNELPFDELLINITKDMYGFNIIRGNDGVYEGRCFYINLERNLDSVYDMLSSLPVSDNAFEIRKVEIEEQETFAEDLKIKEVSADEIQENECPDCSKESRETRLEALAECLPSINKENKDKQNTVIYQTSATQTLLEAIEF